MTVFELKSFLANLILESKKYKVNSTASEIANIDNEEFFKRKNTPKEIHSMYPEIRAVYSRESLKESLRHSMFDSLKNKNLLEKRE